MKQVVEPGMIKVMAGSSSADIRLTGEFEIIDKTKEIESVKKYLTLIRVK